jgi:hypothetical protein
MGGFGSGRYPWSARDTVEDSRYRSFGIKDWVDRELVRPGHAFTQVWVDEDHRPAASIDVRISMVSPVNRHLAGLLSDRSAVPDRLQAVLKYRAGRTLEDLQDIEEVVVIARSRSGFRGPRLQFCRPGCGRRVTEFYAHGLYFRCRKCCGLGYRSQRKGREARGLVRRPGSSSNSVGVVSTPRRFRSDPKACISGPMSGCATKGRKRYFRIKTGS